MFPVLFNRRRGGSLSLAQQLTALLGPSASFWLPGPQYMFTDSGKTVPCGDTDLIQVWADASANGRDLSQATSAARPAARLIGGKWRAVFDGVDDTLDRSYSQAGVDHTVAAVASLSADGNFPMLFVTGVAQRELRGFASTRQPQIVTDASVGTALDPTALTLNTPTRLIASYGTTNGVSTVYRDGVQVAQDASDSTIATPDVLRIGSRSANLFWPGSVWAAVFSPPGISAATAAALNTILAQTF